MDKLSKKISATDIDKTLFITGYFLDYAARMQIFALLASLTHPSRLMSKVFPLSTARQLALALIKV